MFNLLYSETPIKYSFFKWTFTWLIASLPLIFHFVKQYLIEGHIDITEMCASGEFFLVSIVMVAEPLTSLFSREERRSTFVILITLSVMSLATSSYTYSLVDYNEDFAQICESKTYNVDKNRLDSLKEVVLLTGDSTSRSVMELVQNSFVREKHNSEALLKERLRRLSIGNLFSAFLIGASSVFVVGLTKQRHS